MAENIYQRINQVRKQVAYIRKDATVQGYKAVTHDLVTAVLRDQMIANGIVVVPSLKAEEVVEGKTAKGSFKLRYQATFDIAFINMDNPEDRLTMTIGAHADDSGDKAPGKALSYATKYAMLKVFSLETGENEESRAEAMRPPETISSEQVHTLIALAEEAGAEPQAFLKFAHGGQMGKSWSDIPAAAFETCVSALQEKKRRAEQKQVA